MSDRIPSSMTSVAGTTASRISVRESSGPRRSACPQRSLLRERSGDFIRDVFAETSGFDGEPKELESAHFADCSHDACVAELDRGGRRWRLLATRSREWIEWRDMVEGCARADIVVSDRWLPRGCVARWLKLDRKSLEETGGVAVYLDGTPRVETVADQLGEHPWAQ